MGDHWWRDKARFQQEVDKHGSNRAVAAAHGIGESTVRKWRKAHGIPPSDHRGAATPCCRSSDLPTDDGWLLEALGKAGDDSTVEELADLCDVAPRRVREGLERLGRDGYRVEETHSLVRLERVPPSTVNLHCLNEALFDGDLIRVGVISDTHVGSNQEALSELHLAYDILEREGISEVWHTGDIGCGVEVFGRKQHSESKVHTLDEQREYVVEHYPGRKGITTKMIGGNHDLEGLAGKSGWDLCAAVENQRDDMEYLGPFEAWLETRPGTGRWVHLLHGKGGMSYSWSYKAQKMVDAYPGGRKPAVLIVGHWHVRGNIRARDVEVLWPGCFEWQSQFMARLGLQPAVGFHILEFRVADDGSVVEWAPRWYPFYAGRTT